MPADLVDHWTHRNHGHTGPAAALPVIMCRSCGSSELEEMVDLGATPIANAILPLDADLSAEPRYPLVVGLCRACLLVQVLFELPAGAIFNDDYPYYSSYSASLVEHARRHAESLTQTRALSASSLVVEVASNDGYLLQHFAKAGIRVLGIDPSAGPAAEAVRIGVPTIVDFFGKETARRIRAEHGPADVIIANNVMAHVPDLNDFVAGFAELLADDGVLTVENPSVGALIEDVEFDTIYHEHYCYFSTLSVDALMRRHGLFLNDLEFFPKLHGGTIRWIVGKTDARTERCSTAMARKLANGMGEPDYYRTFAQRVADIGEQIRDTILDLKSEGLRLAAYGAAAKGATLLNSLGLGNDVIDFVVDRNTHKQGHLMPGVHAPILPVETLAERLPDVVVVLAWNFADEIIGEQHEYLAAGGRFLVPLPTLRFVPA